MEKRTLKRNRKNRVIGGVAGGIADFFDIDPVIIRLLFVLAILFGGSGVLIYIVLWIVLPENEEQLSSFNSSNPEPEKMENQAEEKAPNWRQHSGLIAGLILITLGVLFLVDRLFPNIDFGDLWPIILIVLGVTILIKSFPSKENS